MKLRDYQSECVEAVLNKLVLEDSPRQLVVMATGLGKALADDEPVLTPDGWLAISALSPGSWVVGSNGNPVLVLGVYPQGPRDLYRLTFSDGAHIVCDLEHMWTTRTKYDRAHIKRGGKPWRTLSLKQMLTQPLRCNNGWRWEIPIAAPFSTATPGVLPLDPYLLGVLLGDGHLSRHGLVMLTTEDALAESLAIPAPARLKRIADAGKAGTWIIGGPTGRGANPVLSAIRALGLEGHRSTAKFIPPQYLAAPAEDRLALLRGIMDTDGHARPDGHVELTLACEQLSRDVVNLVRGLSGTATIREKSTTWTHRGERRRSKAWRLSIAMPVCPFLWKAPRYRHRLKYSPQRRLRSVESIGKGPATCISVDSPDGLFVARDYILTHNTRVFSELPSYFPGQTVVLAHRRKLVKQAAERLRTINPGLRVEIEQADERARHDADVIVASMQTLARKSRRSKFTDRNIGLVIVDECQHLAVDNTYHSILKDFGVFDGGAKLLGVTATPFRGKGESLANFFEGVAYEKNILAGIDEGWLSPLAAFSVYTKTSLADVGTRGGDFKENELAEAVNNDARNLEIVRAWQKLGKDRRSTLVFAVDKAHARSLTVAFRAHDITCEMVIDDVPEDEREDIFRKFTAGDVRVLVNVGIVTEGVDLPPIDCVLLGRPTKSIGLVTQMVGRGTRLWCPHACERYCDHEDSKRDCLVVDMVDVAGRHKLATSATVLGLPQNVNAKGQDLRKLRKALKQFSDENPGVDLSTPKEITLEWIETQKQRIKDLMARSTTDIHVQAVNLLGSVDPTVKKVSNLTWIKSFDGTLRLRIPPTDMRGDQGWVEIKRDASDHFTVHMPDGPALGVFPSEDAALRIADQAVRNTYWDRMKLLDGSARWLKDPASLAQRELIRKLGGTVTETMTKGSAKQTIDALRSRKDSRDASYCTPRQAYALRRMGIDPSAMNRKQASTIIAERRRSGTF